MTSSTATASATAFYCIFTIRVPLPTEKSDTNKFCSLTFASESPRQSPLTKQQSTAYLFPLKLALAFRFDSVLSVCIFFKRPCPHQPQLIFHGTQQANKIDLQCLICWVVAWMRNGSRRCLVIYFLQKEKKRRGFSLRILRVCESMQQISFAGATHRE